MGLLQLNSKKVLKKSLLLIKKKIKTKCNKLKLKKILKIPPTLGSKIGAAVFPLESLLICAASDNI